MNIVFIVAFPFPFGSASSMRARHLYKLIELAGHNVHVISDYASVGMPENIEEYSYEAVYNGNTSFFRRRIAPYKSIALLKKYCKKHEVDCVLTNAKFDRFNMIANFCKKKGLKLLVENCEWYDSSNFKLGKLNIDYIRNQKMIMYDFKKADGFISISRLLDEHNKTFGLPSVRIPTIIDVEKIPYTIQNENDKIVLVYTGNVGKSKELLLPIIQALAESPNLCNSIEFHIYGPSYNEVLKNIDGKKELIERAGNAIKIHGRIPQIDVQEVLKKANYLIFLRPYRRSSNAGFPTKLGESFAVGTPVITNDTGDIGLYVKNNENGFILESCDCIAVKNLLEKISILSYEEYEKLRINARKTAEKSFDYRNYLNEINTIVEKLTCRQ
jgi:glycosyltransferase involved in cell wall biosynthesis